MSLLYTKNRENDLVNMIAAEVSSLRLRTIFARVKRPANFNRSTLVPKTCPSK